MITRRNKTATRRASWLALFAILFQALLPALHHPAMAAPVGTAIAHNLCLAPGSTGPSEPEKAPGHHVPACAICAALQTIGGFMPPTAPVLAMDRDYGIVVRVPAQAVLSPQQPHSRQQARAPPTLV